MSTFKEIRKQLQEERGNLHYYDNAIYNRRQSIHIITDQIKNRISKNGIITPMEEDPDWDLVLQHGATLDKFVKIKEGIQKRLRTTEREFDSKGSAKQILNQNWSVKTPTMLLPLRIHARFVSVKYVAKVAKENILDLEKVNPDDLNTPGKTIVGLSAKDGNWSEDAINEILTTKTLGNSPLTTKVREKLENAIEREWYEPKNDTYELWIRIYPDDVFVHAHEEHLTKEEMENGKTFWKNYWHIQKQSSSLSAAEKDQQLIRAWKYLQDAYLSARASWIYKQTMPKNFPPSQDEGYSGQPIFFKHNVKFKSDDWTQPMRAYVLPERFSVNLYSSEDAKNPKEKTGNRIVYPLALSHNPIINNEDGVPEEIQWLTDFEQAEKIGMGVRIPISSTNYKEGFSKIIVLGVNLALDEMEGKEAIEKLFENHTYKDGGLSILPQGTPTNNLGDETTKFSFKGPPAKDVFSAVHDGINEYFKKDWLEKTDTHYLTELLGIDFNLLNNICYAGSKDIVGAKAMNKLLWSGTLGYSLTQFFEPILSREDIEKTRSFFIDFVSGRGVLPVIQVGNQPYGILATTAYSNLNQADSFLKNKPYERALYENVLTPLNEHWSKLMKQVKHIGDGSILNKYSQEFKELVDLSASTEALFYRPILGTFLLSNLYRYQAIETPADVDAFKNKNKNIFDGQAKSDYIPDWIADELNAIFKNKIGDKFKEARIFQHHIYQFYGKVKKDLIDYLPPAEDRKLSLIEEKNINYLEHLSTMSIEEVQKEFQADFSAPKNFNNFLYTLARQALSWEYLNLAFDLGNNHAICNLDFENHLINLRQFVNEEGEIENREGKNNLINNEISKYEQNGYLRDVMGKDLTPQERANSIYYINKWNYFNENFDGEKIGEWIYRKTGKVFNHHPKAIPIASLKRAAKSLSNYSTASLQRLFTEHIDLCASRLDAWLQGLTNQRLFELRKQENTPTGIYLGAYGYLENVRKGEELGLIFKEIEKPKMGKLDASQPLDLTKKVIPILSFYSFNTPGIDLDKILNHAWVYLGKDLNYKMEENPNKLGSVIAAPINPSVGNQGFMHTLSDLHAITAAILRSGFRTNEVKEFDEAFAINLSSARVRKALFLINGVKGGQQISELLGYQFERFLHDNATQPLDEYILNFRKVFPLNISPHFSENEISKEHLAVHQVVDGFQLVEYYRSLNPNEITDDDRRKIQIDFSLKATDVDQVIEAMHQLVLNMDAVSDLLFAEGIFQVAKGNLEASATALKMVNNETALQVPEIIKTSDKKQLLSHLLGIYFDDRKDKTPWTDVVSPKSVINPHLNSWLSDQLPFPHKICISIKLKNGNIEKIKLSDLAIQPIDFLDYFDGKDAYSEVSDFSKRIKLYLKDTLEEEDITSLQIDYKTRQNFTKPQLCIYEIMPLIQILNELLAQSRPLLPTDLQMESQTEVDGENTMPTLDNSRLINAFVTLKDDFGIQYNVTNQLNKIIAQKDKRRQWEAIKELSNNIFGKKFLIFPEFKLVNQIEMDLAYKADILSTNENEYLLEEWFQGVAQVRKNVKTFQRLKQMRNLLKLPSDDEQFELMQLPVKKEDYHWLGADFPEGLDVKRDNLSIAMELPGNYRTSKILSGMLIDRWKEILPEKDKTSAIAMNYNQPNSEPPQSILLCVAPKEEGNWEWNDLLQTVIDTMDLAKKRAIDYDIIAKGIDEQYKNGVLQNPLQYILPAIIAPVCKNGDTPWVDFSK